MTDPYQILGVTRDASDEQIKTAYRNLVKKYHPDHFVDDPLSDLATEKMKEINNAYDQVMKERRAGTNPRSSQFADIRRWITGGRIHEAEELLDGVPLSARDAEWHFLKGSVCYSRGWLERALQYFNQAHRMDPDNPEYRAALNQQIWQRQTAGQPVGMYGCSCCDICNAMLCANCLCNCMRCF